MRVRREKEGECVYVLDIDKVKERKRVRKRRSFKKATNIFAEGSSCSERRQER